MPKPDEKILLLTEASDDELDTEFEKLKNYEDNLIKELGPEEGKTRALEEGLDQLVERLNAYQKYFEEVESWKEKVQSEYVLVKKKRSTP